MNYITKINSYFDKCIRIESMKYISLASSLWLNLKPPIAFLNGVLL